MSFTEKIIKWYKKNRRDLPWRHSGDPYRIWISEIILQQTRVEQGLSYYIRFCDAYPDLPSLAAAKEQELLRIWQGLGYYSRARNMLFAARQLMIEHNGQFPDDFASLKKMKGVGDYTAAAIASIAFNEAVAVVDGNVKRVMARIFGLEQSGKTLHNAAFDIMMDLIDHKQPGEFNQAVMEFGAIQCVPKNPDCSICIFKQQCFALANGRIKDLPHKDKKGSVKNRYFSYLVIQHPAGDGIVMKKRSANDIWKNLYEFPLIETEKEINTKALLKHDEFISLCGEGAIITERSKRYKHQLSHRTIHAHFYKVKMATDRHFGRDMVLFSEMDKYPVSRLIELYVANEVIRD